MAYSLPILVNATPGSRQMGVTLNALGNRARVMLPTALSLPPGAKNTTLGLRRATLFYTMPNVLDTDTITLEASDDGLSYSQFAQVTFPQGLYDTEGLDGRVQTALGDELSAINTALGTSFTAGGDILRILPNWATERVVFQHGFGDFLVGTKTIRFRFTSNLGAVLGFPGPLVLTVASASHVDAPNKAGFNMVNSINVMCSLVANSGLSTSLTTLESSSGFLEQIPLDAYPGKQVIFQNAIDVRIPIQLPHVLTNFEVALTDELGRDLLITNTWTVLMMLSYDV